ncbi:hypothetical protein KAU11_07120 [Candidatus Babeliales bacterium]|nr:hypothetical protein [Candidatus Babeliales bacterium]
MSSYNFTTVESEFIRQFFNVCMKVVHWKEYGPTEWYVMFVPTVVGNSSNPIMVKTKLEERKIIKMMLKLELLVPEIENDKEYEVQRALGCVIGRIYYMSEEIREELKDVVGI